MTKVTNLYPHQTRVIWSILKTIKIRDQGMVINFLCYVLKYVSVVWLLKLRRVFWFLRFLSRVWEFSFWDRALNLFLGILVPDTNQTFPYFNWWNALSMAITILVVKCSISGKNYSRHTFTSVSITSYQIYHAFILLCVRNLKIFSAF